MTASTGEPPGRTPVLDLAKRQTIIAMLANGSSRRVAAAYVGCATSTITRTAARDPDFQAAIRRAEQNSEIRALRCLSRAAESERYWRAAAWLLERKNPEDFAARQPTIFTEEQVKQVFARLAIIVTEDMPEEKFDQLMAQMDELCETVKKDGKLAPLPVPTPSLPTEEELSAIATEPSDELDDELDEELDDAGQPIPLTLPSLGEGFATVAEIEAGCPGNQPLP
jgi:hypothetical protein